MIKKGDTRLPLERLGAMARILGIDPYELFCLWMDRYYDDSWSEIEAPIQRAKPIL